MADVAADGDAARLQPRGIGAADPVNGFRVQFIRNPPADVIGLEAGRKIHVLQSPAVEACDRIDDVLQLPLLEFRVDRQRQRLAGRLGRFRAVLGLVAEVGKAFLHMQRHGVIDLRADALLAKVGTELVPIRDPDHILIVDVAVARTSGRCDDLSGAGLGERLVIISRVPLPGPVPILEVGELHVQHRGLDFVDAEVAPDDRVVVLGLTAVHAKDPGASQPARRRS